MYIYIYIQAPDLAYLCDPGESIVAYAWATQAVNSDGRRWLGFEVSTSGYLHIYVYKKGWREGERERKKGCEREIATERERESVSRERFRLLASSLEQ